MSETPLPYDAVILAGGRARRMGGGDKCLRELGGSPILSHVIDRVAPIVRRMALSANGDSARFAGFGLPVLADDDADLGPLSGVLAAMRWAETAQVLTVPADTPFLPDDLVQRLSAHRFAIAASPSGLHPVIGLWPTDLAQGLQLALAQGMRRLRAFATENGAEVVEFPSDAPFFNVNTPADLAEARLRISRTCP